MRSACLLPYCPIPVNNGARSIFKKHLTFLGSLGKCLILSSRTRPVGFGWCAKTENKLLDQGYSLSFSKPTKSDIFYRFYGIIYAIFFKMLKQEKAFGHSNPYHRFAFNSDWFYKQTKGVDLCEIHYSYWARLRTGCPKIVIVHDLWSDIMWEGSKIETAELLKADLLVTVSYDDKIKLLKNGIKNVHWSPPCIDKNYFDDSNDIAVVGSDNRYNVEGLAWLKNGLKRKAKEKIHCYGAIGSHVKGNKMFIPHGQYKQTTDPYRQCGIILMLTKEGTGIQIKGVEALAAGRAIIARKGAMRGLPNDDIGWIEVDTPEELEEKLMALVGDDHFRMQMMARAHAYYMRHLEKNSVLSELKDKYFELL